VPSTRLLLVRHGETVWNREGLLQGQADVPLSEVGRAQAMAVAAALRDERLDAAYASDLGRAMETAQICLSGHGLVVVPDCGLRERNFGVWQGKSRAEISAEMTGRDLGLTPGNLDIVPEGGEAWDDVQARVAAVLRQIVSRHAGQTVVVVGHGGSLRASFCALLGVSAEVRRSLRVDNGCICEFDVRPEGTYLVRWNDTHHME